MPSILLEHRLRIRNAADTADLLVVSSVRGDTLPWLKEPPTGDGSALDPVTGKVQSGVYTGRIVDAITSGTNRVITSLYNDSTGRPQLGYRKAFWEFRENGGSWLTLSAGLLTKLSPASDIEWDVAVSEAMILEHQGTSFAPKTSLVTCTANASGGATSITVAALPFIIATGTILYFSGGVAATLTADAAAGATSIAVSALSGAVSSGESARATEPIAAFVVRWPNRGCILGGPVRGGIQIGATAQPDLGGWEVNVADSQGNDRWLQFRSGYGPPKFERKTNLSDVLIGQAVIDAADKFYVGYGTALPGSTQLRTIDETRLTRPWRSLVIELVGNGFYQPLQFARWNGADVGKDGRYRQIINGPVVQNGFFIRAPGLSVSGTIYRLRLFSAEVSEQSPIYWTGHPVDYMAALWDEQNITYDASAVSTVRDAIGRQRRISVRKTTTVEMGTELEQMCYGPFGIGVRMSSTGALQPFVSRIFASAAPSVVITDADVVQQTTRIGELDTAPSIRRVVLKQQRIVRSQDAAQPSLLGAIPSPYLAEASKALDGFLVQDEEIRRENGDAFAIGQTEQTYDVPGMIHLLNQESDAAGFTDQLAKEIFDRRGRGVVKGSTTAIRGGSGDSLSLGDELLINVKQLPNKNKRYIDDNTVGARRMQVVRITPTTIGKEIDLEDSGANAAAVVTLPTLSIAASSDLPRTVAELTITNAATLNAAGLGARVRLATVPSSSPLIPDYTDFVAYLPGQIPAGAIRLPATTAGYIVFAIARSEQVGSQPSAYTSAVSVTLSAMNPPTSVTVTPSGSDGSKATVAWTIGSGMTDMLTDIFLRAQGDPFSNAVRRFTVEAGSVQYVLEGLTPSALYTASVQHRDRLTGDVSTLVDVNFTAGGTTRTLRPPVLPNFFTGKLDLTGAPVTDGTYGLAVSAVEMPGRVEFYEAVETSVGSGTYGTAASVALAASVQGDWTVYQNTAPNDGLRRQVKARHVQDGATASSFTVVAAGQPWGTPSLLPKIAPTFVFDRFRCRLKKSGVQSIPNNTLQAVAFDLEDYDVGGLHDTVTNNSRITIPTGGGGRLWQFQGIVGWANNADTTQRQMSIYKNGLSLVDGIRVSAINGNTTLLNLSWSDIPVDTDYYELIVWQNSGVAVNIDINTKFASVDVY